MVINIEVEAEHPDVTALKQRVKEVAKIYTDRHGWCSEVKRALREAGIDDEKTVSVKITFTVSGSDPSEAVKRYPVSAFAGKTGEEQAAFVAEDIAPKVDVAGTQVTLPVTIVDLELVEEPGPDPNQFTVDGVVIPDGLIAWYNSGDGRVLHYTPISATTMEAIRTNGLETYLQRNRRQTAMCGEQTYSATRISTRGEQRICVRCARRV